MPAPCRTRPNCWRNCPGRETWKVVRLEEHPVREQAAMFYHARQIVSVHGAGLTNLVFAQPGARVVEIFPPDLLEPIYFQIATLFGLHYEPVIAESAHGFNQSPRLVAG